MRNRNFKRMIRCLGKRILYFGTTRACPVCNGRFRKFLSRGPKRPDAQCPSCGALERHRFFWLYLERCTDLLQEVPKRALHIAPEEMLEKRLRQAWGSAYLTGDLLAPHADVCLDITNMPFPEQSFDFLYCSHVLEHVPDDKQAMSDCYRVLTSGGVAFLMVPIGAEKTFEDISVVTREERLRVFGQEDHVRVYGDDYVNRLEGAGFIVKTVKAGDVLSLAEAESMGITSSAGDLFICTKQV